MEKAQIPGYVPVLNRLIERLLGAGVPIGPMRLVTVRGLELRPYQGETPHVN